MDATRICSSVDCGRPAHSRGLCPSCYSKAYRRGALSIARDRPPRHSLTNVDVEAKTATCAICGPTRIRLRRGNRGHECMTVRNAHKGTSGRMARERRIRYRYGLTKEALEALESKRQGRCAICKRPAPLVIDHCHASGLVRDLLCQGCNLALGLLQDDVDRILAAARYIDLHRTAAHESTGRLF